MFEIIPDIQPTLSSNQHDSTLKALLTDMQQISKERNEEIAKFLVMKYCENALSKRFTITSKSKMFSGEYKETNTNKDE